MWSAQWLCPCADPRAILCRTVLWTARAHYPRGTSRVRMNSFRRPVLSSAISYHCVPSAAPARGSSAHSSATLRVEKKRRLESGKISDSIGENSKSSSGSSLPPLTRCLELGHFPPFLPARALRAANDLLAILGNLFEFRRKYLEVPARSGVPTTRVRLRCRGCGSSSSGSEHIIDSGMTGLRVLLLVRILVGLGRIVSSTISSSDSACPCSCSSLSEAPSSLYGSRLGMKSL